MALSGHRQHPTRWISRTLGLLVIILALLAASTRWAENQPAVHAGPANPPAFLAAATNQSANEGTATFFALPSFSDPDPHPAWQWSIDWGDGSPFEFVHVTAPGPLNTSHSYPEDGTYDVMVWIVDPDNLSDFTSFQVTVHNIAPTLTMSNSGPIDEGSSAAIAISATDPAGANDPLSYEFDCDNDGSYEIGPQASNTTSCVFDDDGTFPVSGRVSDDDSGSATASTTVSVNNLAPIIHSLGTSDDAVAVGETVILTAIFTDRGVHDTHSATWIWDDTQTSAGIIIGGIVTGEHQYSAPGNYTPTLMLTDDAGAVTSSDLAGWIQVTQAQPDPPTATPTATATSTPTPKPPTSTPTATATPTPKPPTNTPTATSTSTPRPPTSTATATNTPTPQPPTSTSTVAGTGTFAPEPTNTPPPDSTNVATATETPTSDPVSAAVSTPTPIPPTNTPTAAGTLVPEPTNTPTPDPTATATATPAVAQTLSRVGLDLSLQVDEQHETDGAGDLSWRSGGLGGLGALLLLAGGYGAWRWRDQRPWRNGPNA